MAIVGANAAADAQSDRRALIEQALTEPVRITLENISLREAVIEITEQTGVEVHMAPDVMALAPGGGAMKIQRVDIANAPLREGLDRIFAPLGMTWRVRDDGVHIEPREAIRCLGRAPTWEELDWLAELARLEPARDPKVMTLLRERIQFRVSEPDPWSTLASTMRDTGAGSAEEVLTIACEKLGWSWCLSGNTVVITPRDQAVLRRLQRPIVLNLRREPLYDVLTALADAAGVPIRIEPGALASLPPAMRRRFTLELSHQTAERALEMIAAYTGLGYLVEPEGVLIYRANEGGPRVPEPPNHDRPASPQDDPYVGKVVVPLPNGTTIEWLVRYSELPEDLRARRTDDLRRAFEALR